MSHSLHTPEQAAVALRSRLARRRKGRALLASGALAAALLALLALYPSARGLLDQGQPLSQPAPETMAVEALDTGESLEAEQPRGGGILGGQAFAPFPTEA